MKTGQQLKIEAMEKELKRLQVKTERAKKEADERLHAGSALLDISRDFIHAATNTEMDIDEKLKKFKEIETRRKRLKRIIKKNLIELFDKQSHAELERDQLASELQMEKFLSSMRERKAG